MGKVTGVLVEARLLSGLVSTVAPKIAVFVMLAPAGVLTFTFTTIVKLWFPLAGVSDGRVHEMLPVPPAAGTVGQVQPAGWASETKVVLAGTASPKVTFCAVLPAVAFVTPTVKVRFVPATTGFGAADFVATRSAGGTYVLVTATVDGVPEVMVTVGGSAGVLPSGRRSSSSPRPSRTRSRCTSSCSGCR